MRTAIWGFLLAGLVGGLASSGSASPHRAFQAVSNLEAYWPFEESTGITANDLSGNGHTGTHSGGVMIDAVNFAPQPNFNNLRSITVDGSTGGVNVANAASLDFTSGPGFTLAAWVRPTSAPNHQMGILEKFSDPGTGFIDGYFLRLGTVGSPATGHYLKFNIGDGAAQNEAAEPGVPLPMNSWTHVAGVFDGSSMQIYKNGVLSGYSSLSGPPSAGATGLNIGGDTPHVFAGNIDEARIYNRPLTATEIGLLHDGQPAPTGLAAAPGPAQITVSWTAPANATGYRVYRSLTLGGTYSFLGSTTMTSYLDSSVANPTTYYYKVSALSVLESPPAGPVSAVPDPTAPKTQSTGGNDNLAHRCGCSSAAPGWTALAAVLLALAGLALRR